MILQTQLLDRRCSVHCSTLKMIRFLPPLLPPSFTPRSPHPCNSASHTPYSHLPPSKLASLSYLFYSLPPSPWLIHSPTSLSASLIPLFHSLCLIDSFTPCLIYSPALLCLTQYLLTNLPHSVIASMIHSCLTLSLNQSLPPSLLVSLSCLFYSPLIHSLTHWLQYITLHHLLHLNHSSSSLLTSLPISFTPLHHTLPHPSLLTPLSPSFTFTFLQLVIASLSHP